VKTKNNPARLPLSKNKSANTDNTSINKDYGFFEDVFEVVRQVPKGRVTSYGAIAGYLGTRMSARMVGWAMNASHDVRPKVPAQRVVNRNGMLTGKHHFATSTLMQELLEKDGVRVENDVVLNFKELFWDPGEELSL
jgi:methylated-DNA-protein-cysteine methyltransferase-like protein